MDDNKTVTIHAAYFNHLFTRTVERERLWSDRECLILECEKISKERDELKAKLDAAEVDRETYKDRAEAAERCIEDALKCAKEKYASDSIHIQCVVEKLRAYRENKEEK